MQDWDRLVATWKATLEAVGRVGGYNTLEAARSNGIHHSKMWGLTIDGPANAADIWRIETYLGAGLPPALSRFFLECARSVEFRWQLPDEFPLPSRFRGIFGGGFSLSLTALQEHELDRRSWVETCFPNPEDPYDVVWHQKLSVIPVRNGDYIGIDLRAGHEGEVVYLSHDDGEGHGLVLGADFIDFLRRWTPLGCPGPEDWQWLPFTADRTTMLDPGGEAAREWRKLLRLEVGSG
jgi:hypothetical protein